MEAVWGLACVVWGLLGPRFGMAGSDEPRHATPLRPVRCDACDTRDYPYYVQSVVSPSSDAQVEEQVGVPPHIQLHALLLLLLLLLPLCCALGRPPVGMQAVIARACRARLPFTRRRRTIPCWTDADDGHLTLAVARCDHCVLAGAVHDQVVRIRIPVILHPLLLADALHVPLAVSSRTGRLFCAQYS